MRILSILILCSATIATSTLAETVKTLGSGADAAPVNSKMVSAQEPDSLVKALQDYGVAATLEVDDVGDPVIRTKIAGANSSVYFYGCDAAADCKTVSFGTGFDLGEPFALDKANEWNAKKRFTKSYVSDTGAARLEMDVNLIAGGVSADSFADTIDWWDYSVSEYKTFIGW